MERWRGRTALVTGVSGGIGRAIAIRLLEDGMNVFACARRLEMIETIKDEVQSSSAGELIPIRCDLTKEEDISAMFETIKASKFSGIDVCVNNAGYSGAGAPISQGISEVWRNTVLTNLLGPAICTRETLTSMKDRGVDDGHIINIASLLGHVVAPYLGMYCATKHGIRAFSETLRQELLAEGSGIRVSLVCTELVKTPMIPVAFGKDNSKQMFSGRPHLLPKDVASAVEFALAAPKHVQIHDTIIYPVKLPPSE